MNLLRATHDMSLWDVPSIEELPLSALLTWKISDKDNDFSLYLDPESDELFSVIIVKVLIDRFSYWKKSLNFFKLDTCFFTKIDDERYVKDDDKVCGTLHVNLKNVVYGEMADLIKHTYEHHDSRINVDALRIRKALKEISSENFTFLIDKHCEKSAYDYNPYKLVSMIKNFYFHSDEEKEEIKKKYTSNKFLFKSDGLDKEKIENTIRKASLTDCQREIARKAYLENKCVEDISCEIGIDKEKTCNEYFETSCLLRKIAGDQC